MRIGCRDVSIVLLLIWRYGRLESLSHRHIQYYPGACLGFGLNGEEAAQILRALIHTDNAQVALALRHNLHQIKALPIIANLQADALWRKGQMHPRLGRVRVGSRVLEGFLHDPVQTDFCLWVETARLAGDLRLAGQAGKDLIALSVARNGGRQTQRIERWGAQIMNNALDLAVHLAQNGAHALQRFLNVRSLPPG